MEIFVIIYQKSCYNVGIIPHASSGGEPIGVSVNVHIKGKFPNSLGVVKRNIFVPFLIWLLTNL